MAPHRTKLKHLRTWAFSLFLLLPSAGALWATPLLEIHFLYIGQGDAILIKSPAGKVAIVDAGPPSAKRILTRYLEKLQIKRVNLFLVTHPHLDHFGGWRSLQGKFKPLLYIDPAFPYPSPPYRRFLRHIRRAGIRSYTGKINQVLDLGGGVKLRVLAPRKPFLKNTRSDANSNSIVMRLEYKKLRVLLTGDAEKPTEYRLMRHPEWLPSHLLKVAHHGSHHSSSSRFLTFVRPTFAVISCGKHNRYGHPHKRALRRLHRASIKTFITARHGHVIARSNGKTLWLSIRGRSKAQALHTLQLKTLPQTYQRAISSSMANSSAAAFGGAIYNPSGPPLGQQAEKPKWYRHKLRGKTIVPPTPFPSSKGYVAAKRSSVFHRHSCRQVQHIPSKLRVYFRSRRAAIRSRRKPASDCIP